jgi:hypothetical protein
MPAGVVVDVCRIGVVHVLVTKGCSYTWSNRLVGLGVLVLLR